MGQLGYSTGQKLSKKQSLNKVVNERNASIWCKRYYKIPIRNNHRLIN